MQLSFSPALGDTVHVAVPEWMAPTAVPLSFSATLSSADFQSLHTDGAKVQLWSDIAPTNRTWGEIDFLPPPASSPNATVELSLGPAEYQPDSEEGRKTLSLTTFVPFSTQTQTFSFTYRILYPSGHATWLGTFGGNGSVIVSPSPHAVLSLERGWKLEGAASVWTQDESVEKTPVAKLSNPNDWVTFATAGRSFMTVPNDCSTILLVPARRVPVSGDLLLPPTFALSVTSNAKVSLDATGQVLFSGSGSITLSVCDPRSSNASEFVRRVLAPQFDAVETSGSQEHVFLASSASSYPITITAIPVSTTPSTISHLTVKLNALVELLGTGTDQCSIFTPSDMHALFLTTMNDHPDEMISFAVPPSGGRFMLSDIRELNGSGRTGQVGQPFMISILSSHVIAPSVTSHGPEDILPTPPPSPHLQPISRNSVLNSRDAGLSDTDVSEIAAIPSSDVSALAVRPGITREHRNVLVAFMLPLLASLGGLFSLLFGLLLGTSRRRESQLKSSEREAPPSPAGEDNSLLSSPEEGEQAQAPPASEETAASAPSKPSPLSIDLLQQDEGKISVLVKRDGVHDLVPEANGKLLETRSVKTLNDGVELVEVDIAGECRRVNLWLAPA